MTRIVIDGQRQPRPEPMRELDLLDQPADPFGVPAASAKEVSLQDFYLAGGWIETVPAGLA